MSDVTQVPMQMSALADKADTLFIYLFYFVFYGACTPLVELARGGTVYHTSNTTGNKQTHKGL